ncbi:unnamed protein product [Musa hybrid cultivar]
MGLDLYYLEVGALLKEAALILILAVLMYSAALSLIFFFFFFCCCCCSSMGAAVGRGPTASFTGFAGGGLLVTSVAESRRAFKWRAVKSFSHTPMGSEAAASLFVGD